MNLSKEELQQEEQYLSDTLEIVKNKKNERVEKQEVESIAHYFTSFF